MNNELEKCPFCGSSINQHAFVCAACNAYKTRKGDELFKLVAGACLLDLIFIVFIFFNVKVKTLRGEDYLLIGAAVSVFIFGLWLLPKIYRWGRKTYWVRKF